MKPPPDVSGLGVFHHHIGPGLVSTVVLSIASAASYGLAAVLQHRAGLSEPAELSLHAGLLLRLARRPLWLLGNVLDAVGYLFQFLALRNGSLPLVEPLLVLSLVFALPLAARLEHRRVSLFDVVSAGSIAVGLALFLGWARPGVGHPRASITAWVILTVLVAMSCGATFLAARGRSRPRAAVFLAAGSGIAFGYVAAVTERTGHLLNAGVVHTLANWAPYALLAAGAGALLLTQSAFHVAALRLSLPTLTVAQPLVAIAIGIWFFGERIDSRGLAPLIEVSGIVLVIVGVFALARSPAIGLQKQNP